MHVVPFVFLAMIYSGQMQNATKNSLRLWFITHVDSIELP